MGDKGVVYLKAQHMRGRSFDSSFEGHLNRLLLNSVLNVVCFSGFQNFVWLGRKCTGERIQNVNRCFRAVGIKGVMRHV